MASLLESLQEFVTPELLGTVATSLGEDQGAASKGLMALVPTLLSGMVDKAGDEQGLGQLFGLLNDPKTAGFLDNLGGLVGGGNLAQGDPRDVAGGLIGQMFGDKVGPILAAVASFAGLKSKDSAGGLLGMAGPLVMGFLGKRIMSGGLDAVGLKTMLMGEKDAIHGAVPPSIAGLIGLTPPAAAATAAPVAPTPVREEDEDGGGLGWLMWLIPLLGLIFLAWFFLGRGTSEPETVDTGATSRVNVEEELADVVVPPAPDTAVETDTETVPEAEIMELSLRYGLPGGFVEDNPGSVEAGLVGFLESRRAPCTDADCWFTASQMTFASGSPDLDMTASGEQVARIVSMMQANPSLQLKVGGYTDNTGSEEANMTLSQSRADAVRTALIEAGIAADRVVAEGYGPQFPKASNDTEDGRAMNRRIDLRVRQR